MSIDTDVMFAAEVLGFSDPYDFCEALALELRPERMRRDDDDVSFLLALGENPRNYRHTWDSESPDIWMFYYSASLRVK